MFDGLFGSGKQEKRPQRSALAALVDSRGDSAIGVETAFTGTITARGELKVFGQITGDVSTTGEVVVSEKGKLIGNLICETVFVDGLLEGDIIALKVRVGGTGVITGKVRAVSFTSDEGGTIKGTVTMEESLDLEAIFREEAGLPPVEADPESQPRKRTRKKKEEAPAPSAEKDENAEAESKEVD